MRINCDVGEGVGNEDQLFRYIHQCNIACGGHAGDEESMRSVINLALHHGIDIGAHPSYPDSLNFGRISMDLSAEDLIRSVRTQIENLLTISKELNAELKHIKAHGALYNDAAADESIGKVFCEGILPFKSEMAVMVPCGSWISRYLIENGFKVIMEVFADRNYRSDGTLVPRSDAQALIVHPDLAVSHVEHMVNGGFVACIDGSRFGVQADSICVHSDSKNAVSMVKQIRSFLDRIHE